MRHALLLCGGLLLTPGSAAAQSADSSAFVTRLGNDTLVVERFTRSSTRLEADVVLRVPRTTRIRYVLELTSGEMTRLETVTRGGRRDVITRSGDSLRIETTDTGPARVRMIAADRRILPFIDMVHWPFELAFLRLRGAGGSAAIQPLLSGGRSSDFPLAAIGADSMTITHPTRGTMRARVDARGRLLGLDASATTRKLLVERRPWNTVALDAIAARWSAQDSAGRSLGALSGRRIDTTRVAGATIIVDHGTPAMRGRAVWGALVPFGEVWRTGANRATHFTTDRALRLGAGSAALAVPAGSYTLFSIPSADGGVLIVSSDTGQAGTAYNAARDFGRVELQRRSLAEPVEVFTIAVTPERDSGALRLQWDRAELVAPFTVAPRQDTAGIPARVMQTLRARFPGAAIRQWTEAREGDVVVYDIEFTQQGRKLEADIKPDGTIHNWEQEVAIRDVPAAVRQAVQTKHPGATITLILAITAVQGGKEVLEGYELMLATAKGTEVELTVAPDGTVLEMKP